MEEKNTEWHCGFTKYCTAYSKILKKRSEPVILGMEIPKTVSICIIFLHNYKISSFGSMYDGAVRGMRQPHHLFFRIWCICGTDEVTAVMGAYGANLRNRLSLVNMTAV